MDKIENDSDFSLSPNYNDKCKDDYGAADVKVLNQIKKLAETTDPSEKTLFPTLAPKSWVREK